MFMSVFVNNQVSNRLCIGFLETQIELMEIKTTIIPYEYSNNSPKRGRKKKKNKATHRTERKIDLSLLIFSTHSKYKWSEYPS